jgi:hypothetical protein
LDQVNFTISYPFEVPGNRLLVDASFASIFFNRIGAVLKDN